ncbi:hypothetical protein [Pyramidobacter piscolens]|uniref:hypothetical protein n=1 Tax=Pyramidobacter piscolens TaxID=638849 RepID=UPI001FCAE9D5|nr:hypothetical protein [Pyramidobacter piscolens]BDF77695.1 hypothetical protein CE91St28_04890 [Pyramidobacter piscolens]
MREVEAQVVLALDGLARGGSEWEPGGLERAQAAGDRAPDGRAQASDEAVSDDRHRFAATCFLL